MGMLIAFAATWILLALRLPFLPRDHGRAFAVNGALSKGKVRGVGLILIIIYVLVCLFTAPFSLHRSVELILLALAMLAGYLDDASDRPWNEYLKGAIDLGISVAATVNYMTQYGTRINIMSWELDLHPVIYLLLGTILVWMSINVTNCADGVDGLCASLVIVSALSFMWVLPGLPADVSSDILLLVAVLGAYLCFNSSPSSMLMGDAGSRPLGLFLAVLAMRSGHPFIYLLLCAVLIVDGGLGLIKVSVIRFLGIKGFLTNIRTPIHDELRSKRGWSDTQVVARYMIIQCVIAACARFLVA